MERVFIIYCLVLFSCNDINRNVVLQITNRSSQSIDSVLIHASKKIAGEVAVGETIIVDIDLSKENIEGEGAFPLFIYQKDKSLYAQWGFHDWGYVSQMNEKFYVYDHGINFIDEPLKKPEKFSLFFYNRSSKKIDSIYSTNNAIIKISESTPRSFEVVYDYQKIQKHPFFFMHSDSREYKKPIASNSFGNWNNPQGFLTFEDDTLRGSAIFKSPLEFIVDLEIKTDAALNTITVLSKDTTKIYDDWKRKTKRIVLDYEKFRKNPSFTIQVGDKTYSKDLSRYFASPYLWQSIIFLKDKGLVGLEE